MIREDEDMSKEKAAAANADVDVADELRCIALGEEDMAEEVAEVQPKEIT